MDNAEIAASVARALGLKELDTYWNETNSEDADYGDDPGAWVLEKDGSNLFHPRWQVRCRDWLLQQGWWIELAPQGSHLLCNNAIPGLDVGIDANTDDIELRCPASEFCARAIAELIQVETK